MDYYGKDLASTCKKLRPPVRFGVLTSRVGVTKRKRIPEGDPREDDEEQRSSEEVRRLVGT